MTPISDSEKEELERGYLGNKELPCAPGKGRLPAVCPRCRATQNEGCRARYDARDETVIAIVSELRALREENKRLTERIDKACDVFREEATNAQRIETARALAAMARALEIVEADDE